MILVYSRPYSKQREDVGMPPLRYYVCRWNITRPYLATSKNMKLGPSDCVLIIGLEPEHYDIIPY